MIPSDSGSNAASRELKGTVPVSVFSSSCIGAERKGGREWEPSSRADRLTVTGDSTDEGGVADMVDTASDRF